MAAELDLSDYLAIRSLAFDWTDSYDTKDWPRLQSCLAPSCRLDFRSLQGALHEGLTPAAFAAIIEGMIGDARLKTQHLIGATKWTALGDGSVKVENQIRVAHQRYEDEGLSKVRCYGHGYGVTTHWYRKIGGKWLIEGSSSRLDWFEGDLFGTLARPEEGLEKLEEKA